MADYVASSDIWAEIPESKYGSSDGSTEYNSAVANWVTVASRLIDAEFGVPDNTFYPSTEAQTYYYDGSGEEEQKIGLWVSISGLAISENGEVVSTGYTVLTTSDYLTWPYNKTPIRKLVMDTLNSSSNILTFYRFRKSVKVTGVPGYSLTPPALVQQACKIQVIRWLQRAKQMYQDQGATVEIGGLMVKGQTELDPDIKALLFPIKRELS